MDARGQPPPTQQLSPWGPAGTAQGRGTLQLRARTDWWERTTILDLGSAWQVEVDAVLNLRLWHFK